MTTDVTTFDPNNTGAAGNLFAHLNKNFRKYYLHFTLKDFFEPACMIWHKQCPTEDGNMASLGQNNKKS